MASGLAFLPPKHFNFARLEEWPRLICKLEHFREASDLDEKSKQKQVSFLIYSMGDILQFFHLTEDEWKSCKMVEISLSHFREKEKHSL